MNDHYSRSGKILTHLSRETILAEPAGNQLDRWVARYCDLRPFHLRVHRGVLAYSSDISTAWEFLEHQLSEAGGLFCTDENGWRCSFNDAEEVVEKTMPLAVCKAALLEIFVLEESSCRHRGR